MSNHPYARNYRTPSPMPRSLPSLRFYARLAGISACKYVTRNWKENNWNWD
mgnify:CR=1 FL=1